MKDSERSLVLFLFTVTYDIVVFFLVSVGVKPIPVVRAVSHSSLEREI